MWSILETTFTSQTKARTLQLRMQLHGIRKRSMPIIDYYNNMKTLSDYLVAARTQGQNMTRLLSAYCQNFHSNLGRNLLSSSDLFLTMRAKKSNLPQQNSQIIIVLQPIMLPTTIEATLQLITSLIKTPTIEASLKKAVEKERILVKIRTLSQHVKCVTSMAIVPLFVFIGLIEITQIRISTTIQLPLQQH